MLFNPQYIYHYYIQSDNQSLHKHSQVGCPYHWIQLIFKVTLLILLVLLHFLKIINTISVPHIGFCCFCWKMVQNSCKLLYYKFNYYIRMNTKNCWCVTTDKPHFCDLAPVHNCAICHISIWCMTGIKQISLFSFLYAIMTITIYLCYCCFSQLL